ncbi:uncharacterized protein LOC134322141 [Trichomycterus rosablanca]|uniref:uncharacterized protein LOC134322141 n=1 Tax=Trichomycterus rosablanca TaxID=2290929 RepID=UPI002F353EA3
MTPQKQSLPTVMEVPAEVLLESNSSKQTSAQTSLEKHDGMVVELDGQDSVVSPESIPPCLPSAGWLADFGNVYPNKTPNDDHQQVKNQSNWPEGPQQTEVNQNADVQSVSPNSAPEKSQEMIVQRVKTSGVVSLSDVEGYSRSCPDVRGKHKVRLCKNCLSRRKTGVAADDLSPKTCGMKRHKVAHSHLMGDKGKLCGMCRHDPGKKARYKASSSGSGSGSVNQYRKSQEVSENAVYPLEAPKKCSNGSFNAQTSPSARHAEKCPTSHQSKLREQNCSCDHLKVPRTNPAWSGDGYGHCSDVTRERNEENLAFSAKDRWRDAEQKHILHQQSDKSWKGGMQVSDTESTKSGGKTRTHKQKQCAQTPEIHRRDTRC